jgi:hypothetical protein
MSNIHFISPNQLMWRRDPLAEWIAGYLDGEIVLNPKVPTYRFQFIEENIEAILLHEQLHYIIDVLEGLEASTGFDELFKNDCHLKIGFCKDVIEG